MPEHSSQSPSAPIPASPSEQTAGNLRFLPIESLRTSYASLRPGSPSTPAEDIALLPIRVVPVPDGSFEVIDGFKRLQAWGQSGWRLIPVVLERPSGAEEHKRLLLLANSPPPHPHRPR